MPALIFLFVFAVNEASTDNVTSDSIRAVSVAVAMVHFHTINLDFVRHTMPDPTRAIVHVDGRLYPLYPWAVSLFSVPWIIAIDGFHHLGIGHGSVALLRSEHDDLEVQVFSMSVVLAIASTVVYFIALRVLSSLSIWRRRLWSTGVAVIFLIATPVWSTAGRAEWQQGPSVLLLCLALLSSLRLEGGEGGSVLLGFSLGFAYAVRPTDIIPLVVLLVWVCFAHRGKLLTTLAGATISLGPFSSSILTSTTPITPFSYPSPYHLPTLINPPVPLDILSVDRFERFRRCHSVENQKNGRAFGWPSHSFQYFSGLLFRRIENGGAATRMDLVTLRT